MYFESREQAGKLLAAKLVGTHSNDDCAVIALTDSSVLVAKQIAESLKCSLSLLLIEKIEVPGEGVNFGNISQDGKFNFDSSLSAGEIEEYTGEYRGYLEDQKQLITRKFNKLLGEGGHVESDTIRDTVVFLVADGLRDGSLLDAAVNFLKPIRIKRLVIAVPIVSVQAVDKMHILADELCVLDVRGNFLEIDHYYDDNSLPSHEDLINLITSSWNDRLSSSE
jgi:predicted phosphoribosyltransferase